MTTFHHISLGTLMPDGTTHILAWYVNDGTATRLRDALGKPSTEVNMDLEQSKEAFNVLTDEQSQLIQRSVER